MSMFCECGSDWEPHPKHFGTCRGCDKPKRTDTKTLLDKVNEKIEDIDKDERFHYEPAAVQINAPLALIQVDLKAKMSVLRWVKNELENNR